MNTRLCLGYVDRTARASAAGNLSRLAIAATLVAMISCATAIAAPAAASPAPAAPAVKSDQPAEPAGPEAKLARGMAAAEVKQLMGKPKNVKTMDSPSGKAEVWSYVREVDHQSTQVQVGAKPIVVTTMGSDGKPHQQTIAEEPIMRTQHTITEETVDLLMFNDHFLDKKVTRQKTRRYN